MEITKSLSMICIVLALTGTILASMEDDEKECAEQLTTLATCIPFVSGAAKQPTKECCDDTSKVKAAQPKCLCVLIKQSADPSMGLPINTTLALQMPDVCKIDAKVSDCPSLLKIPADSPDAKIFKVANADSSTSSTTNSSSDSTKSPSSSSSSSAATSSDNAKPASNLSSSHGTKTAFSFLLLMRLALFSFVLVQF